LKWKASRITKDGHDDVCVWTLDVSEKRNDFINDDHLVEATDQSTDTLECVDSRLVQSINQSISQSIDQ